LRVPGFEAVNKSGGVVLVQLRFEEDGSEWLESLFAWIDADERLGMGTKIELQALPRVGTQGSAFDVINATIGDGVSLAGLAISFATWRRQNAKAPSITIERDGLRIEVSDATEETIERIIALGEISKDNKDEPTQ
jgi:hypothetical protein